MKQQIRVLGIDDSPFEFGEGRALVVGVVARIPNYVESVMKTDVQVDGTDATNKVVSMIRRSRYREQVKLILLDGIALAGFNVLDIDLIHESLDIPVLTVTRDPPDLKKMRDALEGHFDDWKRRYELVSKHELREIRTMHKPLLASGVGLSWGEFQEIVSMCTVRGVVPEPLRLAHLIASAMTRGESYGRP